MNLGEAILYLSLLAGAAALLLLFCAQLKKTEAYNRHIKWLIRFFTALLFFDFALLSYYFAVSDVTINYVWSYTSKYYPIYYKLSGALAGQEGTLLFWAMLIALGSLWLSEGRGSTSDFVQKTQIIVVSLGLYFAALALLDSPFKTIYEIYPELPRDFVPEDGAGLNPILLDPWMALHPFTMFIGYAGVTVPFAGAAVYLLASIKGDSVEVHRTWTSKVTQWSRIAWLFLTIAIAFGGIWSYKVLGWGGFWAWDPVETASLIPWLMLTASVHALAEHRKDARNYSILAPLLLCISFALVVYATLVTRSGIFESVHAFIAGGAGPYLILLAAISFAAPAALALVKYYKSESRQINDPRILNRTNIFYLAILSLAALTFVSFFGITYPATARMLTGNKYGVGIAFFNLWSYPFFIAVLLLAGLGLRYSRREHGRAVKEFLLFTALTVIAALIKPNEAWNIVDYSAIISPEKPALYTLIGSLSALSFLPPSAYIIYAAIKRGEGRLKTDNRKRLKELGVIAIHLGIVFITLGAVFSVLFVSDFSVALNLNDRQSIVQASPASLHQSVGAWGVHEGSGRSNYGVRLLDYKEYADYKRSAADIGMGVQEFYARLSSLPSDKPVVVRGVVSEVRELENFSLIALREGENVLYVVAKDSPLAGELVIAAGTLHFYEQNSSSLFLIAEEVIPAKEAASKITQELRLAVYEGSVKIGEGVAKLETYEKSDVRRVMIDRGLLRDVYVIPSGISGEEVSLTIKLMPLVNYIWFGIVLFIAGILAVVLCSDGDKVEREQED